MGSSAWVPVLSFMPEINITVKRTFFSELCNVGAASQIDPLQVNNEME